MNLKLVVNNDEEDLPQPKTKRGGRGGGSRDYLSPMKCGTEFLVRGNNHFAWLLNEFMHAGKKEGNVLLIPHGMMNEPKQWIWVDPVLFCVHFELRAILEVPEDE